MRDYTASTYGDRVAERYDAALPPAVEADTAAAVAFLAEHAGAGPVLELGVGTGRIALPLAALGLAVHGIDASQAMVAQLRAKPGGERVRVTFGDFADVGVEETFALVFVVFNTLFALASQEEQVRCFANVARRLAPGGVFVVEAFVPDLTFFTRDQRVHAESVAVDEVVLDTSRHDQATQQVAAAKVVLSERGVQIFPVRVRYAWPSELDLMARLASLRLRDRFASWGRDPFTSASTRHISLYEKTEF